jgi:hypothetical protein
MLKEQAKSIRTFIGSKDFEVSRSFYRDLGFEEMALGSQMSFFKLGAFGFYLQNAYVKKWVDNTMIFLEVSSVDETYAWLEASDIHNKYKRAKLSPIRRLDWGAECFLHDPSGVLWHFGEFAP